MFKLIILGLYLTYLPLAHSTKIKVMNFNTMCDFCHGSEFFQYEDRLKSLNKIILKHKPDIISLQELRTTSHITKILAQLRHFQTVSSEYMFMSYADPAIAFDRTKYTLIEQGQFWLGPNEGKFTWGWRTAIPRRVHWVKLKDLEGMEFVFVSSHFDNLRKNLAGAANLVNQYFKVFKDPIIFAADTNITPDMPEFTNMIKGTFIDAFDIKESFEVLGEYKSDRDICYDKKGEVFPVCRVEHILLSSKHKWKVGKFIIDADKNHNGNFPSDHRPVITTVELLSP